MLSHRGLEWLKTGPLRRLTMSELLRSLPPRGHPCLDGSTLLLPRQGDAHVLEAEVERALQLEQRLDLSDTHLIVVAEQVL